MTSWTDERVELLKKLWVADLSAEQIAGELGGITRNAVIGKVHRLGLSGRAKAPSSSCPRPRKARTQAMTFNKKRAADLAIQSLSDVEVDPNAPETIPGSRSTRGKPYHISSRERHLRGLDNADAGPAFAGIANDVVQAFAPFYK